VAVQFSMKQAGKLDHSGGIHLNRRMTPAAGWRNFRRFSANTSRFFCV